MTTYLHGEHHTIKAKFCSICLWIYSEHNPALSNSLFHFQDFKADLLGLLSKFIGEVDLLSRCSLNVSKLRSSPNEKKSWSLKYCMKDGLICAHLICSRSNIKKAINKLLVLQTVCVHTVNFCSNKIGKVDC